jgi:1,4-dihydroxy-2-naphthoyl-CoA hydrolase
VLIRSRAAGRATLSHGSACDGAPREYSVAMPNAGSEITVEAIRERIGGSLPADMGVEPLEITDERCRARMVVDDRHLHPGGLVHGGAWVALADSVAAWQTFRHLPAGYDFTTVEMKLNVFAGGRPGDELIATAEHLHAGRSTHVIEVRVHRAGRLVANLLVTQLALEPH